MNWERVVQIQCNDGVNNGFLTACRYVMETNADCASLASNPVMLAEESKVCDKYKAAMPRPVAHRSCVDGFKTAAYSVCEDLEHSKVSTQ